MSDVWQAASEQFDRGKDFVPATIQSVRGACPRNVGTRFLVRRDGKTTGTIVGGLFEEQVLEQPWRPSRLAGLPECSLACRAMT